MKQPHIRKPEWLKIKLGSDVTYDETRAVLQKHCLHTICTSGRCPNQGECWSRGTATFMIGGAVCTRACKFCNTETGRPLPLDPAEPRHVAESVRALGLKHAVVTSVDRDDLPDKGSAHWVETIRQIRELCPSVTIEVLIPDFDGQAELIAPILQERPEVVAHNMETVRRLTPIVRSRATYDCSISVLAQIAEAGLPAKTGLMLGLGETQEEILETMDDLRQVQCSILTLGQYLQPTRRHYPVQEYVHPDRFTELREIALGKGFRHVESGPLVRSSYHAERHLE
ncbi:lipoyl synthase [Porphyromonas uenonis 60-3]|uniref:Lipoyl synthase n=1 Tax=Porphyromonas uenonis 60-3 TaxID=596327 RepID=C2MDT5_9PORP|nr:lipoyl synthase [Porphyromonas uenonis]EEK16117.1 lipoyl synthase [Porphyromonas uenonis 60-3]